MHTLYRSSNQNKPPHSPSMAPILRFGAHKHQHTHTQPPSYSMSASSSRQPKPFQSEARPVCNSGARRDPALCTAPPCNPNSPNGATRSLVSSLLTYHVRLLSRPAPLISFF